MFVAFAALCLKYLISDDLSSLYTVCLDQDSVQMQGGGGPPNAIDTSSVRIRNSASNVLKNPELRTMISQSVYGNVDF